MSYSNIAIIYNPNSTGDSEKLAKKLQKSLQKDFKTIEVECVPTKYAGHAIKLAQKIAESNKTPLIISSSGDGGYNEVVNGVMKSKNTKAVCAVLPAGNANDHSRTMQDGPLVKAIKKGEVQKIDLLKLEIRRNDEFLTQYAHSYIGLGLTPVVAVELNKHTLNAFKEMQLIVRTFFKYRPFKIKHGKSILKLDSLLFGNINQMAKVLTLAPENKPDDGKFEVIKFPSKRRWFLVKRLAQAAVTTLKDVHRTDSYEFTVIKKMPIQLDGEVTVLNANDKVTITSAHKAMTTVI